MVPLPFFLRKHHFVLNSRVDWNSSETQVLGIRTVPAYAMDAGQSHPAVFFYRAEAEVQYKANGKQFDVWLPASHPTSDRLNLELWLVDKKGTHATVYWNPNKPEEAEVRLKSAAGSKLGGFD